MSKEKTSCKGKNKLQRKKQVVDFRINTKRICEKEDRLNNLRSLTFGKNNIEENVKERILLKKL